MRYRIDFIPEVTKTMAKYKKSNPQLHKKRSKVLEDISQHPRTGLGHPEPLVGGNQMTYSRRIAANHRIIYDIHDDTVSVMVLEVEGHYGDK